MSKIVICVPVYDTEENKRSEYTKKTFYGLFETVDTSSSYIVFINNNSCKETTDFLERTASPYAFVINNKNNLGTAEAINLAIKEYAQPDDYVVKLDNDVIIHQPWWANDMMECMNSDKTIGVLGLKRKDLPNSPGHKQYPTNLQFANRENGEPWRVIEECDDIIGTCHMYSPALRKKIGYLYQPGVYGFDDVLMCHRSKLVGFRNAFYPSIEIDHIDTCETEYTTWKQKYAGASMANFNRTIEMYDNDPSTIYYNPFESKEIKL